jgi:hypothetical protein
MSTLVLNCDFLISGPAAELLEDPSGEISPLRSRQVGGLDMRKKFVKSRES